MKVYHKIQNIYEPIDSFGKQWDCILITSTVVWTTGRLTLIGSAGVARGQRLIRVVGHTKSLHVVCTPGSAPTSWDGGHTRGSASVRCRY